MADIRTVPMTDDFERADENPIQPPWYTSPGSASNVIDAGRMMGINPPPDSVLSYHSSVVIVGPAPEVWGRATGNAALVDGWRFGFYTLASLQSGGGVNGYQCIPWLPIGGSVFVLRRVDAGIPTDIGAVAAALPDNAQICLMRRNGSKVEVWMSATSDSNGTWNLILSITDTTYVDGPWHMVFGTNGYECGWSEVGGGRVNRTQIYRWLGT